MTHGTCILGAPCTIYRQLPSLRNHFLFTINRGWGLGALLTSCAFWILCVSRDSWALEVSLAPWVLRINISIQRKSLLHTHSKGKLKPAERSIPIPASFQPLMFFYTHRLERGWGWGKMRASDAGLSGRETRMKWPKDHMDPAYLVATETWGLHS